MLKTLALLICLFALGCHGPKPDLACWHPDEAPGSVLIATGTDGYWICCRYEIAIWVIGETPDGEQRPSRPHPKRRAP